MVTVKTSQKKRKYWLLILIFPALCLLLVAVSALSNLGAPLESQSVATLSDLEKARLAEAFHLRQELGAGVWPGWEQAQIPLVVYNETYAFLVGLEDPADGWRTVPRDQQQGSAWERVPDDDFYGQPYYRQLLPADGTTPQAFTVRVGEHWAGSLQTMEWMLISLSNQVRADFSALFPHWWFANQALSGSDGYICNGLLHESFHAYQGLLVPERLNAGERANQQWHDRYPWENEVLQADWELELETLEAALQAESHAEAAALAEEFLAIRAARRTDAGLTSNLMAFERQREWVEGLAKYTELSIWQSGYAVEDYQSVAAILVDPDFDAYDSFPDHWQKELGNMVPRAKDAGDGRFYYSGMAQAFLLDRLMPGWKEQIFQEDVWLETLLAEALEQR